MPTKPAMRVTQEKMDACRTLRDAGVSRARAAQVLGLSEATVHNIVACSFSIGEYRSYLDRINLERRKPAEPEFDLATSLSRIYDVLAEIRENTRPRGIFK